mgnify:CR=1 FL=1|tara:strand:+ start:1113 stop:1220 length:108 start_codon:yes stop_codon:yes gene_type:complete
MKNFAKLVCYREIKSFLKKGGCTSSIIEEKLEEFK